MSEPTAETHNKLSLVAEQIEAVMTNAQLTPVEQLTIIAMVSAVTNHRFSSMVLRPKVQEMPTIVPASTMPQN